MRYWNTFNITVLLLVLFCASGCSERRQLTEPLASAEQVTSPDFQKIIDGVRLEGSILIYDQTKATFYSNDFARANKGFLPASTFKVPHAMIALESNVVASDTTILPWDGTPRNMKIWNRAMPLSDAIKFSCVPCFQDIARQIGVDRMKEGVEKLKVGDLDITPESIDQFWLTGDSEITQMEQVDFWHRFHEGQLPIAARTDSLVKKMTLLRESKDFKMWGKTGWAASSSQNIGWFVGMLEAKGMMYFFATNVEPREDFDMSLFPPVRRQVTMNAFRQLGVIPS